MKSGLRQGARAALPPAFGMPALGIAGGMLLAALLAASGVGAATPALRHCGRKIRAAMGNQVSHLFDSKVTAPSSMLPAMREAPRPRS